MAADQSLSDDPAAGGKPVIPSAEPKLAAADAPRRRYATLRVGPLLTGILDPAARARGFAQSSILAEWSTIVGVAMATRCQPIEVRFERGRTSGGVLVLQTSGAAALELQHAAPQLIERINRYFGFSAVRSLRFAAAAAPLPPRPPRRRLVPLDAAQEAAVYALMVDFEEGELKNVLVRLGRSILLRRQQA